VVYETPYGINLKKKKNIYIYIYWFHIKYKIYIYIYIFIYLYIFIFYIKKNFFFFLIIFKGFSKDLGTLPINELLREYLFYVKNFIKDVEHNKYIRLPFNSRDNIEIIYNQIKESDFFKLQNDIITNLYNALQFLDNQLIDLTIKMLDENSQSIIWLIILGMIMFLILGYFVINQLYKEKIKEMNTLVSFIFLVPPSIISKNEKFKR